MNASAVRPFRAGQAQLRAGDWPAAAASFAEAAACCPDIAAIRALLGIALLHTRQPEAAERHLRAALALDPAEPSAGTHLGLLLNATARHTEAAALLLPLADRRPDDTLVQVQLAEACEALGRYPAASRARQRVAELTDAPVDWIQAARAWLRIDAPRPAEHALRQVLSKEPHRPAVRSRLGQLLLDRGQLEEAESHFQAALALQPEAAHARVGLARLHLRRRALAEADAAIAPLITDNPAPDPEALALWADIQRRRGPAPAAAAIPILEAAIPSVESKNARSLLLHQLARLRDAAGDHSGAFAAWSASKQLQHRRFRPDRHAAALAALRAAYPPGRPLPRSTATDPMPVFIVGMPRSGTSLLEQMLDCHPALTGIGEREEIRTIGANLSKRLSPSGQPYYLFLDQLDPGHLTALAERHLKTLRELAPGARHAIDKMPHNFLHLGLISQLFPRARILHCVRDPVDTCFSCFRQRFGAGLPYTIKLDWLGHFYREYAALMAHWETSLPLPMHTVRYEDLVRSPEQILRGVTDFLSVPWDPRCLRFNESRRDVGTASFDQVQKPLYTSSINRSAPYLPHLGPLLATLGISSGHAHRGDLGSTHRRPAAGGHLRPQP